MLRPYDITELRSGMKVGRAVKDFDGKVIIKENVKLTSELLDKLRGKNVFTVYISTLRPKSTRPLKPNRSIYWTGIILTATRIVLPRRKIFITVAPTPAQST